MKGVGWIVILLAMLTAIYLVAKDLTVLGGDGDGGAVLQPLERAKDAAGAVDRAREALQEGLDKMGE